MDTLTEISLREILDYVFKDEENDWIATGRPKVGHIFNHIIRVTEWLDATQK
jgi:hypothetical protein